MDLPVVSVAPEDAADHFGFLSAFAARENPASGALTQELLGWQLQGPELIPDIEQGHYFKVRKGLGVGRKAMALQRPVRVDDYLSAHSITHEFDDPPGGAWPEVGGRVPGITATVISPTAFAMSNIARRST